MMGEITHSIRRIAQAKPERRIKTPKRRRASPGRPIGPAIG
jgi:hypothetical protein